VRVCREVKSPAIAAGDFFASFFDGCAYRSNMTRMIRGIGMPTNQRRMGMGFSFQD
jgi:hypothetical protein